MASSASANPDMAHASGSSELTSGVAAARRSDTTRLEWVDQAKGIGIILVVYGHVLAGVRAAGVPIDEQTFHLTWDAIYAFHIPLFFFLSGWFFPQSWAHRGTWGLLLNKVDTLIYPYVLWSLLQGFLQVALSHQVNNPVAIGDVLALLWRPRQEFWFLYALFFTYLFACILYLLAPQRFRGWLLLLAVLVYCLRVDMPRAPAFWYPTLFMPYFLAGALLQNPTWVMLARPLLTLAISVTLFVAAQVLLHELDLQHLSLWISVLNLSSAAAGVTATLVVSELLAGWGVSFVAFIGRMSLQIYLLHTIVAAFVRIALQRKLGINNLEVHLILGTLLGVLVPLAFAYLLERWRIPGFFSLPPRLQLQPRRAAA